MYLFFKKKTKQSLINVGSGIEKKIVEYARFLKFHMKYDGKIIFDKSKPDGTPRKLLDSSTAFNYGWKPKINMIEGFKMTYLDFINNYRI